MYQPLGRALPQHTPPSERTSRRPHAKRIGQSQRSRTARAQAKAAVTLCASSSLSHHLRQVRADKVATLAQHGRAAPRAILFQTPGPVCHAALAPVGLDGFGHAVATRTCIPPAAWRTCLRYPQTPTRSAESWTSARQRSLKSPSLFPHGNACVSRPPGRTSSRPQLRPQ
jgi:hypothetical protein